MGTRVESVPRSAVSGSLARLPFVGAFARLVGPAALTAAGMAATRNRIRISDPKDTKARMEFRLFYDCTGTREHAIY